MHISPDFVFDYFSSKQLTLKCISSNKIARISNRSSVNIQNFKCMVPAVYSLMKHLSIEIKMHIYVEVILLVYFNNNLFMSLQSNVKQQDLVVHK